MDSPPDPAIPEPAPASAKTIALSLPLEEQAGDQIGPYKVLQKLGEGGCGMVYLAEQAEPVRRRVALKVIKLGMDTREVIARFEAERQALALMDHPNIAKVLDAGATATGRPYFVMELVRGIKITEYCDQHKLTTPERIAVFIQVCQAIQHAHQKGIIHRDIKPSNVLASDQDGAPFPKVIDFGIAKATHGRLTDQTVFTAFEQFIGTPAYMSPEQAEMSNLDIDTRSDIYSLGVLLYELLTGKTPFDPKELLAGGVDGLRKILREKEPPPPSTRLKGLDPNEKTATAQQHRADSPRLINTIRGDLDWVVMKCIEKDRSLRYETANALAMDLRRFLNNEPVLARPPSQWYRLKKTVQRHRVVFASAAAIFLFLLLALFMTGHALRVTQSARSGEARQRQLAEQERAQAQISEQKARQAEAAQAQLRERAERQEHLSRLRAYASDINLAQQALAIHNLGRAQELLNRQRPGTGEKDLRGWEWRYLWRQCQSDALFTLCQQSNAVLSLAVSHDGHFVAVGEQEHGGASVWDLRSRKELGRIAPDEHRVQLAFSPAQNYLACSSSVFLGQDRETNHVRIWDAATRQIVTEFGLDGLSLGLRFSDDGKTLVTATAGPDNKVSLWRIPEGTKRAAFAAAQTIGSIGTPFTAAGDLSVAFYRADDGQTICALDLNSGSKLWQTKVSGESVTCLAVSPDRRLVAVGDGILDTAIRLLDARTGTEVRRLDGHRGYVIALTFTSDGKTLISGSADQTIRLWDLSEERQQAPPRVLRGHKLEVWSLATVEGSTMLVSGSKDGIVNVWDSSGARHEQLHRVLPARCDVWSFGSDAKSIVMVGFDGQITRWHGDSFAEQEPVLKLNPKSVRRCLSTGAHLVASAEANGSVSVWDLQQKRLLREIGGPTRPMAPMQISADNSKLALIQLADLSIHMWDLKVWQEIPVQLPGFKDEVLQNGDAGAMSPDGRWALLVTGRGTGWLWNSVNGQIETLSLDLKQPADAAFSPDGAMFAIASRLGYVRLWETATRRQVASLRGVLLGLHSVAFSPDGTRLAAGSNGQEAIKLWDLGTQQELLTLEGEGSVFQSAAFSPDGNAIGALNSARNVNVWLTPSWTEINFGRKVI